MSVECPRCLEMNPNTNLACPCGYDLSALTLRRFSKPLSDTEPAPTLQPERGMSKVGFSIGVAVVWIMLSLGEGWRLKSDMAARDTSTLVTDGLLIGVTDLAGALAVGALAWIGVWIFRACEAFQYRPCPKRITLAATIAAAGLVFVGRLTPPGLIFHHVVQVIAILGAMAASYYAGSKGWLGKW